MIGKKEDDTKIEHFQALKEARIESTRMQKKRHTHQQQELNDWRRSQVIQLISKVTSSLKYLKYSM